MTLRPMAISARAEEREGAPRAVLLALAQVCEAVHRRALRARGELEHGCAEVLRLRLG